MECYLRQDLGTGVWSRLEGKTRVLCTGTCRIYNINFGWSRVPRSLRDIPVPRCGQGAGLQALQELAVLVYWGSSTNTWTLGGMACNNSDLFHWLGSTQVQRLSSLPCEWRWGNMERLTSSGGLLTWLRPWWIVMPTLECQSRTLVIFLNS